MTIVWAYTIVDRDLAIDDADAAVEMYLTHVAYPDRASARRAAIVEWQEAIGEDGVTLDPTSVQWTDQSELSSTGHIPGWTPNDQYIAVWGIKVEDQE